MLALWVHREPAFLHALTLLEYFKDTPKARTAYNSEYRTENLIVGEEWGNDEGDAREKECPPAFNAEIIFWLDYDWMKDADYKECCYGDDKSEEVHE